MSTEHLKNDTQVELKRTHISVPGRPCRMICIAGGWMAKSMVAIETLIHTEAGIIVPDSYNMYSTGGYDGFAFKFIQCASKRLREKRTQFKGFIEEKKRTGDMFEDADSKLSIHHTTQNRYHTIYKAAKDWATPDPKSGRPRLELAEEFSQLRDEDRSGAAGGPCGRGLHSFTFQLNVSAFCGIGGAVRVCLGVILRVFRRCRVVLRGVEGLKGVFRVRYSSG